jgi:SAM-dependent methyltransferase
MQTSGSSATRVSSDGYNPDHFARLARIEGQHFWFTARRALIASVVRRIVRNFAPGYRVLEVGCGTGNVLSALKEASPAGQVFGLDRFLEGLVFARRNGAARLIQGDAQRSPFGVPFEVIGAFDVLEHIPDDEEVLRDFYSLTKPGGSVVLTVPAYQWLWSDFDEMSHHQRRYSAAELEGKLCRAGFERVWVSPFMMTILPLVWLHRRKRTAGAAEDPAAVLARETRLIPLVNGVLRAVLSMEARAVSRGVRLPFGTSLLAVAARP